MGSSEDELIQLRNKNELTEKNLRCLMVLGYRAAEDYDRLYGMYEENQKQYESLKQRCQDSEAKLSQLQNALVPACEEYNQLNRHLQIETACRTKLETITTEVTRENKKLKHQSRALLDMLGDSKIDLKLLESIDDECENSAEANKGVSSLNDLNALNEKITSLEEDLQGLQRKLQSTEAEKEAATKGESEIRIKIKKLEIELLKVCKKNEEYEQMISNFRRSSFMALEEFGNMKDDLEKELLLKQRAEEYAHEMLVQRDTVVRQSSILMTSAMSDSRVMHALNEIDKLNKDLETVKREHLEKVKILEEQISTSEDIKKIKSLETELEIASSEVSRLHQAVQELEEWKLTTLEETKGLRERLDESEDKLLPPPPPAPPPPPPCPPPFLGPKLLIVKKSPASKTTSSNSSGSGQTLTKTKDNQLADAMSEMIARIRSGVVLNKGSGNTVKPISKPEPPKAIMELENILKSISVKRSDDVVGDCGGARRTPSSKSSAPPPVLPKMPKSVSVRKPPELPPASKMDSELEKKFSQRKASLGNANGR